MSAPTPLAMSGSTPPPPGRPTPKIDPSTTAAPYIRRVFTRGWQHLDGTVTPRVVLIGAGGVAAALTPTDALHLADALVDAAEHLDAHNRFRRDLVPDDNQQ